MNAQRLFESVLDRPPALERGQERDWAKRFPNPAGEGKEAEIEVRELYELEDFAPSEWVERFRDLELGKKK